MPESADPVRRIADAVLYEGYILWPYRRSAMKNQQRWTFGGVYPRTHSEGRDDDPWTMQTQCLLEGPPDAAVDVEVRFLQVVERLVARQTAAGLELADEVTVAGERHVAWDEAVERKIAIRGLVAAELASPRTAPIATAPGEEREDLLGPDGDRAGAVLRRWRALRGAITVSADPLEPGLHRLSIAIANESPSRGGGRQDALRQTFCSTHTVVRARGGDLVSLTDPPDRLRDAAEGCENAGTWPVLVGERGERRTLLSSPIILPDYPQIAPESPGDLFDGGEIDQLLTLSILSMTDEERREMRESDPRAREILERTESLTEEELMRLHGAIREFQSARA